MDNAASGDATTNDRDGLGLMFHDCRHGRAAPLAHHHDATALAALVLASTPIDASEPMIFWPDVAAKPPAIDFNELKRVVAKFAVKTHRSLCSKTNPVFACSPDSGSIEDC